jgi:hypothetical protein
VGTGEKWLAVPRDKLGSQFDDVDVHRREVLWLQHTAQPTSAA